MRMCCWREGTEIIHDLTCYQTVAFGWQVRLSLSTHHSPPAQKIRSSSLLIHRVFQVFSCSISIILRCWIFYHSPPTSMLLQQPLWTPHKCSYRIQVHSSYRWFKLHNTNIQPAFGPCNVLGVHHENTNVIRKMKPRLAPSSPTSLFNNYQLHSSLHHNAQLPSQVLVTLPQQHWAPRPYKQAMVDGASWWADG